MNFDESIDATARDHEFSGVVRVAIDRMPVFEAAYGLAERALAVTNMVTTRFGVASGGKLFTALGIGTLIKEDRIGFETRLDEILAPSLPNLSPDVTIRHLLCHTSGVFDYYDEELVDDFDTFELSVPASKLLRLDAYRPMLAAGEMKFAPGARFSYSNGGYVLLGLAIEAVSGMPYQQFIEERVFRACGMTSSGFFRFDRLPSNVAAGYIDEPDGWRTNIYSLPIIGGPDGGAFSTARDVERLWLALLDGSLLSRELTAAFVARNAHWKGHTYYGHGLWIHDDGSKPPHLYIEGSDAGVSFKSTCYSRTAIATVMSNTSEGAWPVADALDRLFQQHDLPSDPIPLGPSKAT